MVVSERSKDMTYAERATWGKCPVCSVGHGEWCNGDVGISLGQNVRGEFPEKGVHIVRLQNAPTRWVAQ